MPAGEIPQTFSKAGETPARFKDAGEVITLAAQLYGADQKRSIWRANVERLWAGEPVYSLAKLQAMGQSWRARTNYRGLEGVITENCTLDYDLETQGPQIVCIYLDLKAGKQEKSNWEQIMADEFKWMLQKRWSNGYNFHIPKRNFQKNLHGLGIHFWPDTTDNWIPRTPSSGEVLFPEDCPFDFDADGDFFMTRDFVPSFVLYNKIKNRKEAAALGWDVDMAWKALTLIDKQTGRNNYGTNSAEWLARRMTEGDIGYWATRQSGVYINSVYARDFETGKVSQWSVAEGLDLNQFLYKKENKFDRWPIEIFPYDIGNGNIHSVKGLGDRMKEFFEMQNRMLNAGVDNVMIGAYPNAAQTIQNMDPDKMKLTKIGGMNWLPYGVTIQPTPMPDLRQSVLAMNDTLDRQMVRNNRGSGIQEIEQQDRMTGQEYSARSQDINHLGNASVAMQKAHLDRFYDRIVRLAAKPSGSKAEWAVIAREWRDRCVERGVPMEAFSRIGEVTAMLAYGKGSASARTNAYRELFQSPVYLQGSQQNQIAIERGYTGSILGQSAVDLFCRNADEPEIVDGDESFAVQENNALVGGGEALAASSQDQVAHLQIHFSKAVEIVQGYQQGQVDPQQAYTALAGFGPHIKQHLDYLAANPFKKPQFKEFFNQWQQLSRIADKLRADIESAAEAEPPEQQVSDKLKIGLANVQAQERVGLAKVQSSTQLKMLQQAQRERLDQQKHESQQRQANVKMLTDIQRANVETAASVAQDTALTEADIRNKQKKQEAATK